MYQIAWLLELQTEFQFLGMSNVYTILNFLYVLGGGQIQKYGPI